MKLRSSSLAFALAACGLLACNMPALAAGAVGVGPNPTLPAPEKNLVPTVNIAPAKGWPQGARPTAPKGFRVTAFAGGLAHPRWVYVLPNGDVLVAESDAPAKPEDEKGVRGLVTKLVMKRAGSGVGSANRITLLRDANGDGIAE
ncbi:MAG: sorbosone dehydrogenase, partial [Ramlibacter sp.]|nr:sorbosone dehydrogenase [Ramlibacter sp.]